MNILHTVQEFYPSVGGMQEVARQLSVLLADRGNDVVVATGKDAKRDFEVYKGVRISDFQIKGNEVFGYKGSEAEVNRYISFVLNNEFDVVTNFAAQIWSTDLLLPHLQKIQGKKVLVPTGFSSLYSSKYRPYYKRLREYLRKYDLIIFHSKNYRDIEFARANGITNYIVIPNGASEEEFLNTFSLDYFDHIKSRKVVLTVGTHNGEKGHKESIEIFRKAKIKNTVLLIVGNRSKSQNGGLVLLKLVVKLLLFRKTHSPCYQLCLIKSFFYNFSIFRLFDGNKIDVLAGDRDNTIAAFQRADLFLFPSNIECSPLVLFECLASRTPFLSSDVGNAKEIAETAGSGIILPSHTAKNGYCYVDIRSSSGILKKLIDDDGLLLKMKDNGYNKWLEQFTWGKIAQKYESAYQNLLSIKE
jgi:glycosyltransferase involved in cell wall biosynthesis